METTYKFWYITRDDDGFIVEAAVRFWEGLEDTQDETDILGNIKSVTRFRFENATRLRQEDLVYTGNKFKDEFYYPIEGEPVFLGEASLYYQKDFGLIKTHAELVLFMNKELDKDTLRDAVSIQNELVDIELVR